MPQTEQVLDEELAESLKQAKKKPRNFAAIVKGTKVVKLLVSKRPIKQSDLTAAKTEGGGTDYYMGVCEGDGGSEMAFRVTQEPPIKNVQFRVFIEEQTGLKLKASFQVVSLLEEVDEVDLSLPGQQSPQQQSPPQQQLDSVPKQTVPPPAPPQQQAVTTDAVEFATRLKTVRPQIDQALASNVDNAQKIKDAAGDMAIRAKGGDFSAALQALGQVEDLLKQSQPSPTNEGGTTPKPPTQPPPKQDLGPVFTERLTKIKPQLSQAMAANHPLAAEIKVHGGEISTAAKQGNFEAAIQVLDTVEPKIKKVLDSEVQRVQFEAAYNSLRGPMDDVLTKWGDALPQNVKDKRSALESANSKVTTQEKALEFGLALAAVTSEDLAGKLKAAQDEKKSWDEAKTAFEKDYGAIRSDIQAISSTWGDAIPQDLKDKRTEVTSANTPIAEHEKNLDYVQGNLALTSSKLAEKVAAAKDAKQKWDTAKADFEKDYNPLRATITAIVNDAETDVSQELKTKRTAAVNANKQVTEKETALDFPEAVKLMTSLKFVDAVNAAKAAREAFDTAKGKFNSDYVPLQARIQEVILAWGNQISTAMLAAQDALNKANEQIVAQSDVFNYVKAVELMGTLGFTGKLTTAEGLKTPWENAKVKYQTDYPPAKQAITDLCKHPGWKDVDPAIDTLISKRKSAETRAAKRDFVEALPFVAHITTNAPGVKATADKWVIYRKAEEPAKKLVAEVKGHGKKEAARADYDQMKDDMAEALNKATQKKFDEAHVELAKIAPAYDKVMKTATTALLAEFATAKVDELDLHAQKGIIAKDIADLRQVIVDATTNMNNGLHKAAVKMTWDVYNKAVKLKSILDAAAAYEVARKSAEDKIKELKDLNQPKIATQIGELETKLADAAKLAADKGRRYSDAQVLLKQIESEQPAIKKLAEQHGKAAKDKEDSLKKDPDKALEDLRAVHLDLSNRAAEVVKAIETLLATAKGKLDEADRTLKATATTNPTAGTTT